MSDLASEYSRRMIDVRTRLVHASTLTKLGHYEYGEELACSRAINREDLFPKGPHEQVTCLGCIAKVGT